MPGCPTRGIGSRPSGQRGNPQRGDGTPGAREPSQLSIEESHVECRVVDHEFGIGDEGDELFRHFRELGFVVEVGALDAVHSHRALVDGALGIQIAMERAAGHSSIHDLDAAYFNDSVTELGFEAGGFGIEDDLAHGPGVYIMRLRCTGADVAAFRPEVRPRSAEPSERPGHSRSHRVDGLIRELVDALVAWDPRVALDPAPLDLVCGRKSIELLPQVLVLDRLTVGGLQPRAFQFFTHSVMPCERTRVGIDQASDGRFSASSARDDGGEFHAVVGGERFRAATTPSRAHRGSSSAPQPPGPGLPRQAPSV